MSAPIAGAPPPTGTPPASTAPTGAPAAAVTPPPAPPPAPTLDDHDDGLFDTKAEDPPWVKRLRTQGANYRVKVKETAAALAAVTAERDQLKAAAETSAATQRTAAVKAVAEKHGLWDPDANDKKGGLLSGISLGDDPAKMEEIAAAITARLRPTARPPGLAARRPATVAAATSGTSDAVPSGTGQAAAALRAFMEGRISSAG
jgi:hypothetical protein